MSTKTDDLFHQLSQLDPAGRLSYPGNAADIDLRIRRILDTPWADAVVREPVHKPWRRPVVFGLAASVAMAFVAVLMWASPADGSFSSGKVAAPEHVRAYAPLHVTGKGRSTAVSSGFVFKS